MNLKPSLKPFNKDKLIVILFYGFSTESGEMYGEVDFGHGNIKSIAAGNKYVAICFVKAAGM